MITSKDVNKELRKVSELTTVLEKDDEVTKIMKALLKLQEVNIKLLRDLRTNLTTIMKHYKIELVKDERKDLEAPKEHKSST